MGPTILQIAKQKTIFKYFNQIGSKIYYKIRNRNINEKSLNLLQYGTIRTQVQLYTHTLILFLCDAWLDKHSYVSYFLNKKN